MARVAKEELPYGNEQIINFASAVEELNGLTSQDLNRLLRESENFTIQCNTKSGLLVQIDLERLAWSLPLHLIAVLVSSGEDDITFFDEDGAPLKYLLHGLRLLHSFSDLASRHLRFEQIILEDSRISEQVMDLVFYTLLVLARYEQDTQAGVPLPLLHSALVTCSLHLLTSYISPRWQDLVPVILAHPKVDTFVDVSFDAIHVDIKFLCAILSPPNFNILIDSYSLSIICQNCEAALQFVQNLCQQKMFRDHVLKNKELCQNGGILYLAHSILDLNIPQSLEESLEIVAAISRLKSKILSTLLQLCEAENISYLDEVAGSPKSMNLAKSVVLKILDLLKAALGKGAKYSCDSTHKRKPKGLVLLNSMRLADIFSDDSNFRSFFMSNITWILAEILAMPHEFFYSSWCSPYSPVVEEDAVLDHDPFMASGAALLTVGKLMSLPVYVKQDQASSIYLGNVSSIPQDSYAKQRTSYLVKIIANLHCFVPNICEDQEKDQFLHKFCECLHMGVQSTLSRSSEFDLPMISAIVRNLGSLIGYAESLIPNLLNEDDVRLLRLFYKQLIELKASHSSGQSIQRSVNEIEYVHDANSTDADLLNQDSQDWGMAIVTRFKEDQHSDSSGEGCLENDSRNFAQNLVTEEQAFLFLQKTEEADKQENMPAINGVSESSAYHEEEKLSAMCKLNILADGLVGLKEHDQNERNHRYLASQSSSGSLKDDNKEVQKFETAGSDFNDTNLISETGESSQMFENSKEADPVKGGQDDDKLDAPQYEEKQPRKRKRNIMNERQITLIEKALEEEPEMQRNSTLLQQWADKLSLHGSELTPSQLKNWLNNRKARLARAARDARASSEGESTFPDKSYGSSISHFYDSPESGGEESCLPSTSRVER